MKAHQQFFVCLLLTGIQYWLIQNKFSKELFSFGVINCWIKRFFFLNFIRNSYIFFSTPKSLEASLYFSGVVNQKPSELSWNACLRKYCVDSGKLFSFSWFLIRLQSEGWIGLINDAYFDVKTSNFTDLVFAVIVILIGLIFMFPKWVRRFRSKLLVEDIMQKPDSLSNWIEGSINTEAYSKALSGLISSHSIVSCWFGFIAVFETVCKIFDFDYFLSYFFAEAIEIVRSGGERSL